MENNIKKKLWIGLCFSTLALAGCSRAASDLGMQKKEVQAITGVQIPRVATAGSAAKITGEGSLIRSMLMLTLLAQVVPGDGRQPVDIKRLVKRLQYCKPSTLPNGTCAQKLQFWASACRASFSWELPSIGKEPCEQQDYLAPYVGQALHKEREYCIWRCNELLNRTRAMAEQTGMAPPKNKMIAVDMRPPYLPYWIPNSDELRRVVNGKENGHVYLWREMELQYSAEQDKWITPRGGVLYSSKSPRRVLKQIKQVADENPIKAVQLLREYGIGVLNDVHDNHILYVGNYKSLKQQCDHYENSSTNYYKDTIIGLLKTNFSSLKKANRLDSINTLEALAQNATDCAKVEKMMQDSAVVRRQRAEAHNQKKKRNVPGKQLRNQKKNYQKRSGYMKSHTG